MQFPPSPQTSNLDFTCKYIIVQRHKILQRINISLLGKSSDYICQLFRCGWARVGEGGVAAIGIRGAAFHMNGAGRGRAQAYAGYPGCVLLPDCHNRNIANENSWSFSSLLPENINWSSHAEQCDVTFNTLNKACISPLTSSQNLLRPIESMWQGVSITSCSLNWF